MADYAVPVKYLFKHITDLEIVDAPKITSRTIEMGSKYSPDFVCTPFKYTLGTMIESIEKGANVLIQAGGGCRYGYYSELQNQILKDLDYDIVLINLVTAGYTDPIKIYKELKKISKINIIKSLYYLVITKKMVEYMDNIDDYIRKNIGFEVNKNSFINLKKKLLKSFSKTRGYFDLRKKYKKYLKMFKKLPINKPKNPMKIAIIGELYTIMEPFANYNLEYELAKNQIEITRFTNVDYLLFKKKKEVKKLLKNSEDIKYKMGADASDNICRTRILCEEGYDGIIHIKSSFCTPEIAAMLIINRICKEYKVPIIFFSFDANTSEVGLKTRLEAFYDMLEMRRKN
ncbi:MAG: hypothetical protein E7169_05195 [Firmicutes bacterium]|nr:hypothetical protein [Bacillota bacterium]